MKQLKILSSDYSGTGGIINISFNEPILVEPNATIAMDKFSMDVQGVSTNIEIPDQTVFINTNYGVNTSRPAVVSAGKYATITDLLAEMNTAFNGILNTDDLNSGEDTPPDSGLFFLNFIDEKSQHVAMGFGSLNIDFTNTNWTLDNLIEDTTPEDNTELTAESTGDYSLTTNNTPVVRGGVDIGLSIECLVNDTAHTFRYGLFDPSDNELLLFGIEKVGTQFYYVNNGKSVLIPGTHFIDHLDYNHQFFVDNGQLRYQIYDGNTKEFVYGLPSDAFDGFSFNSTYYFNIYGNNTELTDAPKFVDLGICYQSVIDVNTFGVFWDYASFTSKKYLNRFPLLGATPERTILYDFTPSPILQNGLGFSAVTYDVGPATSLAIVAEKTVKFDTFYQLALQIPSVQLESYIADSDRSQKSKISGTRVNNICYFTPQKSSQTNKSIYVWEQRELVFVSLSNKQPINMNSMQFRVIDVATGIPVQADALSFNLYISEKALL